MGSIDPTVHPAPDASTVPAVQLSDEREYVVGVNRIDSGPATILSAQSFIEAHVPDPAPGVDNCPTVYNPDQNDSDSDGRGDACDNCPELTIAQGDAPLHLRQTNCNVRIERERLLRPRGDACDPYPCNPINEAYTPGDRRSGCFAVDYPLPWITSCQYGSHDVHVGYAPNVASAANQMALNTLEVAPTATPAALVSPIWRCVCVLNGVPITDPETCANAALTSACPVRHRVPLGALNGAGWRFAHPQLTGVTTDPVHETGGMEVAPNLS